MSETESRGRKERKDKPHGLETVAILVDGGFYRVQAKHLFGVKPPAERAKELESYCKRHLEENGAQNRLYRIFYYDCPPSEKKFLHPLTKKEIRLGETAQYKWMTDFIDELSSKRKVALRTGEILESEVGYVLKPKATRDLCQGKRSMDQITEDDFRLDIKQKGVDTRICLDIASLSYKHLVTQIILIAGDSDFVPAAKHARREGIDFILDPMRKGIRPSLNKHIDGLRCKARVPNGDARDFLHINYRAKEKNKVL